jgi:hypothetical protein
MWTHVRTFLLVSLITVMIWVFAEAESLSKKSVRADVVFETDSETGRFVQVLDGQGWRDRVEIAVEGSTAAVNDLEADLRRGIRLRVGNAGIPPETGENLLEFNQILRALAEFTQRGVTVVKVDPPTLKVVVDELIAVEMKVEADVPGGVLEGVAAVKPERAKVWIPRGANASLMPESTVKARVSAESLAKLIPGRLETVTGVTLDPPGILAGMARVRVEPAKGEVSLTLKSRNETHTIPSVPVHVRLAAGELERWDITVAEENRFIRDVRVTGPGELIDRIRRNEIRLTATLALSFDELERGVTSKDVTFSELPTELKFEADRTTVRFTARKRTGPPAGPGRSGE